MRYRVLSVARAVVVGLASILCTQQCIAQTIDPKGLAILQRLIDVRNAEPDVSVEFNYEIGGEGVRRFEMHLRGERIRSDEFAGDTKVSTFLVDGEDVWAYHFSAHSDVQKTDVKSVRSLGFNAFSPRVFGVTTFLTLDSRLEDLLFTDADSVRVLPRQQVTGVDNKALDDAGVALDIVEVDRGNVTLSNAVDATTGRIYRRLNFVNHKEDSRAVATYETDNTPKWVPSTVRMFVGGRSETLKDIKCMSTNPDSALFEMRAMGIPGDTPVVDVAKRRRIGIWNGERIVERYEAAQVSIQTSDTVKDGSYVRRHAVLLVNLAVVGGFVAYAGYRRWSRR